MMYSHDTSTPHVPATNGVAERAVGKVKEGTRCQITQSGFPHSWWNRAARCYCFLTNITDISVGQTKTPYELRFGAPYNGIVLPFGAACEYKPESVKGKFLVRPFGQQMLPAIFVGYHQREGGKPSGDYLVLDSNMMFHATSWRDLPIYRVTVLNVPETLSFPLRKHSILKKLPSILRQNKFKSIAELFDSDDEDAINPSAKPNEEGTDTGEGEMEDLESTGESDFTDKEDTDCDP